MMYDKDNLVLDFIRRTRKNLKLVESLVKDNNPTDIEAYEVTQFINSLLGLLIIPQQALYDNLPETPLSELTENGWPEIKPIEGCLPKDNLYQLLRYLRNSVAHFNVEFLSEDKQTITGIRLWNYPDDRSRRNNLPDWKIELSLENLKIITNKFLEIIEEISQMKKNNNSL